MQRKPDQVLAAGRVPDLRTRSGWYAILPSPPPARRLAEDVHADVAIVGAGFAGLTAAHRLRRQDPGCRIVILEAQRIAWGACGRNSGFMIDLPHHLQDGDYRGAPDRDRREIRMNRQAIDYARSMIEEFSLQEAVSHAGRINAAAGPRGMRMLKDYREHLDRLGEDCTVLDAEQMRAVTGSAYYLGGLHLPGCLVIQPAAYVRGVAAGLSASVDLYEQSPVVQIRCGGTVRAVTPGGTVHAEKLILAVNGHLESFGLCRRRLMHVALYASMTRELSRAEAGALGGEDAWGVTPMHSMGTTVRRLKTGRIVVRNHIVYSSSPAPPERALPAAARRQDRSFRARFPMLGSVTMEHRWSGMTCLSRNDVPVFGEVAEGVYAACCQNGLGVARGTLAGLLIADHVLGVRNETTDALLDAVPPRRLYPEPFMTLGAAAHLWWGQMRAGREV